jgi:DNA polymerase-4
VAREVYDTATALYDALRLDRARIRLVGVRVEGLAPVGEAPHQLTFGERERGWREAEQAVDAAVRRFGSGAVRPASLVRGDEGPSRDDADQPGPAALPGPAADGDGRTPRIPRGRSDR